MSQGFRLKYDQMREGNPTKEESTESGSRTFDESYPEASHARCICFAWQDGKRMFLNYSFLVSGEYFPEENSITLIFTSQTLTMKGVNMEGLFYSIMHQLTKQITCTDVRYNLIGEGEKFSVNEILIKKDKE